MISGRRGRGAQAGLAPVPGGIGRHDAELQLPARELRRNEPANCDAASADLEGGGGQERRQERAVGVDADDRLAAAAVVEEVEMQRRRLASPGGGGVGRHERRPDVGRAQDPGGGQVSQGGCRATREIVGAPSGDRDRLEHVFLRGDRASAVVDSETARHHDEERPVVPEAQLDPEELRVALGIAEHRRHRPEVCGVVDDGDLHAIAAQVDGARGLLECCSHPGRWPLKGEKDVLREQVVTGRIAVGPGGRGHQQGSAKRPARGYHEPAGDARTAGRGERISPPRRHPSESASPHWVQPTGCVLSRRSAVVGVPPGTTKVTFTTAGSVVLGFLTMNVFAPVS